MSQSYEDLEDLLDQKIEELERVWEVLRAVYAELGPTANLDKIMDEGARDVTWEIEMLSEEYDREL